MQSNPIPLRPAPAIDALQAHQTLLTMLRELYAPEVVWTAPARDIRHTGREEVILHLLREASAMREPKEAMSRCATAGPTPFRSPEPRKRCAS